MSNKKITSLSFVSDIETIPVTLASQDGKSVLQCELREMDGVSRDSFLDDQKSYVRYEEGTKKATIISFKGLASKLLQYCLYNTEEDRFFTEEEINKLPSKVISQLQLHAQEMNGMKSEEEEEAKKD